MDKGMRMLNEIIENSNISKIASCYKRSPLQVNKIHESDSEIIKLKDNIFLAITTDSISEEIETGLYDDPWLIGWMAVTPATMPDFSTSICAVPKFMEYNGLLFLNPNAEAFTTGK